MPGAIDIVVNLFTPFEVQNNQTGFDAAFTDPRCGCPSI